MIQKRYLVLIGFGVVGVAIVGYLQAAHQPNINIVVSPSVATLKLDAGTSINGGKTYVASGAHSIMASFSGFSSQTVNFTVKSSAPLQEVDILLTPNSQEGINWLLNHPADQKIREGVGGKDFHAITQQQAQNNPLINELPYVGPGYTYRVDYGSSTNNAIAILVTFYSVDGRQAALTWIREQGYDPAQLTITYKDATSTPQPQTNNPNTD